MDFRKMALISAAAAVGAIIGAQTFIWRVNHLPQNQTLHISEANQPIGIGAAAGVVGGDLLAHWMGRANRRRQLEKFKRAMLSEAEAQGLSIDDQAVIVAAFERIEKEVTGN